MSIDQLRRKNRFLEKEVQRLNEENDQLKAALEERMRIIKSTYDPVKMQRIAEQEILPVAVELILLQRKPVSGDAIEHRVQALRRQRGQPEGASGSVKRACRKLAEQRQLIRVAPNKYSVSSIVVRKK